MFIETETTPNPEVMTFRPHMDGGGMALPRVFSFPSKELAEGQSPLASAIFGLDGVREVFLGTDFISVMKSPEQSWATLKPLVVGRVIDHFAHGGKIILSAEDIASKKHDIVYDPKDKAVVEKIEDLIDTRIRPAVARDGGNIILEGFDKGVVYLALQGACSGCPSSTATLKAGIENILRHFIPEVTEVRQSL